MDTYTLLTLLKLVHLGALIFWVGPSTGAWLMLRLNEHPNGVFGRSLFRVFLRLVWIEHIALGGLIVSGLALAATQGYFQHPPAWFAIKLLIVLGVIMPFELLDIWFSHFRLPALLRAVSDVGTFDRATQFYHRIFTPLAVAVLVPSIAMVVWLALGKTF